MKIDPYKHKERYLSWKEKVNEKGIFEISKENSDILIKYLDDMENGLNVSAKNKKGSRSYTRLNSLRQRLIFMCKQFEKRYKIFYNFIRKHQAINCCSYELATEIKLKNPNKWLELIKLSRD